MYKILSFLFFLFGLTSYSFASVITFADSKSQTLPYEVFNYDFTGAPTATGGGTLSINARGDYSPGGTGELVWWTLKSSDDTHSVTGDLGPDGVGSTYVEHSTDDVSFTQTTNLLFSDLANITSDGNFNLTLSLSNYVNIVTTNSYISWTLSYETGPTPEVPIPVASWLFLSGLLGLIRVARK